MREVNRAFAMRMMEKRLGKPEKQILEEAAEESDEWPMGRSEFETLLHATETFARHTLDYFSYKRPSTITRDDVEEIRCRISGMKHLTGKDRPSDAEIEDGRKMVEGQFILFSMSMKKFRERWVLLTKRYLC